MNEHVEWINHLLKQVNDNPSKENIELIESCGKCCAIRQHHLEGIKELKEKATDCQNINDYVEFLKSLNLNAKREDNAIVIKFGKTECTCLMAPEIDNPALCYCTIGHEKYMWGEFFNQKIDVELVESLLRGGNDCIIKIKLK